MASVLRCAVLGLALTLCAGVAGAQSAPTGQARETAAGSPAAPASGPAAASQPARGGSPRGAATSQPAGLALSGRPRVAPGAGVLCPVTGRAVQRDVVTRFRGKWVYFADAAAREKFAADPLEYAEGLQKQWEADAPPAVQVKCPVTGAPPDGEIFVGVGADAIYFATEDAKAAYERAPAKYAAALDTSYTVQTGCASCEMAIDPRVSRAVDGVTLYFCCKGCAKAADREPRECLARAAKMRRENLERIAPAAPTSAPAARPKP